MNTNFTNSFSDFRLKKFVSLHVHPWFLFYDFLPESESRFNFFIAANGKKVFALCRFERPVRLTVRTAEPHSENSGSIPLRGATFFRAAKAQFFFAFRAGNFSRIA